MSDESKQTTKDPAITFTYRKLSGFKPIKVDGIVGGLAPSGEIVMSVFSERLPIPKSQHYEVTEGGVLKFKGQENELTGIVRDVEASLHVRPETAVAIINWLVSQLRNLEQHGPIQVSVADDGMVSIKEKKRDA